MFRPRHDPSRAIYDALEEEALRRRERNVEEWIKAERQAVLDEAIRQADILGLKRPSIDDVKTAEQSAVGYADYGAKWAYAIERFMRSEQ